MAKKNVKKRKELTPGLFKELYDRWHKSGILDLSKYEFHGELEDLLSEYLEEKSDLVIENVVFPEGMEYKPWVKAIGFVDCTFPGLFVNGCNRSSLVSHHIYPRFLRCKFDECNFSFMFMHNINFERCLFYRCNFQYVYYVDCIIRWCEYNACDFSSIEYSQRTVLYDNRYEGRFAYSRITGFNDRCPSDGSFVGWKMAEVKGGRCLVKLLIPEDAERCSGTGKKCRCSKAVVVGAYRLKYEDFVPFMEELGDEEINSIYDKNFKYRVGDVIEPSFGFDGNWENECSEGIHFFLQKRDALTYHGMIKGDNVEE